MTIYRKARFTLDGLSGEFDGFTHNTKWNGWACPFFTKQAAEKVLLASQVNGYIWHYDSIKDTYEVSNVNDPVEYMPEMFSGVLISTKDDNTIKVYSIGAFSWTWIEID